MHTTKALTSWNSSKHHPCPFSQQQRSTTTKSQAHIKQEHTMTTGASPDSTDRNPQPWYTADKTILPLPSQHEDAQTLLTKAITTHTTHENIQTHHEKMDKSISMLQKIIKTQLRQHTRSKPDQTYHPTRTHEIQTQITNAYRAFEEAGIDLMFDTMDLLQRPKSQTPRFPRRYYWSIQTREISRRPHHQPHLSN